jgi:hypothetical protein
MKQRFHWHRCFTIASAAIASALLVALPLSYWRVAGWQQDAEHWVIPPGGAMQELHVTTTALLLTHGRVEWANFHWLRAVIPAGSPAAGAAQKQSAWVWDSHHKVEQSAFGEHWHASAWNDWRMGDLGLYAMGPQGGASGRIVSLPIWLAAVVAGTPVWWLMGTHLRSRRRIARGQCPHCGYDRRVPGSGSCPECGDPRLST